MIFTNNLRPGTKVIIKTVDADDVAQGLKPGMRAVVVEGNTCRYKSLILVKVPEISDEQCFVLETCQVLGVMN